MTVSNSNFYILHLREHPGQNEDIHYPIYHLIIYFRMITNDVEVEHFMYTYNSESWL